MLVRKEVFKNVAISGIYRNILQSRTFTEVPLCFAERACRLTGLFGVLGALEEALHGTGPVSYIPDAIVIFVAGRVLPTCRRRCAAS